MRAALATLALVAMVGAGALFGSRSSGVVQSGAPAQQEEVMVTGQILSPWVITWESEEGQPPQAVGRRPAALAVWQAGGYQWQNLHDITGQSLGADDANPDPNLSLWEVQVTTAAAFDALEADGRCYVLWETVVVAPSSFGVNAAADGLHAVRQARGPGGAPSPAEFGRLRAFMVRSGVRSVDVDAVAGRAVNGRARAEIGEDVRTWLRDRPYKREPAPTPGG